MQPEIIRGIEQNSPEWLALRAGKPTASQLAAVMSGGNKTYLRYVHKCVAEIIMDTVQESVQTPAMRRGHELEPTIRSIYEFVMGCTVEQVTLVRNAVAACSPDGLVGADGLFEAKSKQADLMVPLLANRSTENEWHLQVQGQLWITQRKWCDVVVHCPDLGTLIERVERDEDQIAKIHAAVLQFNADRDTLLAALQPRLENAGGVILAGNGTPAAKPAAPDLATAPPVF